MLRICLAALIGAAFLSATPPADAAEKRLSLAEAVELAMRVDPAVAQARIAEDRGKLAVLRAQLDRVSLKIDGQLQELFVKGNIAGPTLRFPICTTPIGVLGFDRGACAGLYGSTYNELVSPTQSPQTAQGTFNLTASLNVPVFSGFRVESTVKRAQLLRDASTISIRQARKDTALSVARAYWSVRRIGLQLEVAHGSLERLREAEMVADGRLKAGLAPPIDRNRASLRRLQLAATIADLEGQLHEAAVQLAVSLGVREDLVLTDVPEVPETPPPPAEQLLAEAHGWRPEIVNAKLQAEAQHQTVRIAMSGFYPQLNGIGLFQLGNNAYDPISGARGYSSDSANPFSNIAGNLTLGVSMSMNFFDTLNTYTAQKDARLEESRLIEERRRWERVIDADVRSTHAHLLRLYGRRGPLVESRNVARDNLTILEARYKNGDALIIEYLDGQKELNDAEQAVIDLTAQLQQAWLELDASLGKTVGVK